MVRIGAIDQSQQTPPHTKTTLGESAPAIEVAPYLYASADHTTAVLRGLANRDVSFASPEKVTALWPCLPLLA